MDQRLVLPCLTTLVSTESLESLGGFLLFFPIRWIQEHRFKWNMSLPSAPTQFSTGGSLFETSTSWAVQKRKKYRKVGPWKMEKWKSDGIWWDNTWERSWCCTMRPKQEDDSRSSKQIPLHFSAYYSCTFGISLPLLFLDMLGLIR